MKITHIAPFVLLLMIGLSASAQNQTKEIQDMWDRQRDTSQLSLGKKSYLTITKKQLLKLFDDQPSFGMFHDNYFTTGVPTNKEVTPETADAKYQISISQRLTKSVLPFQSTLLLTYTQKSFWDIYANSSPFSDNNYNPGLTLVRPVLHGNQLRGVGAISIEHESNGLDSTDSRSWNYVTWSGVYFFNANITIQAKLWAGLLGTNTEDLFKYRGHGLFAFNYRSNRDKIWVSVVLNPRGKFSGLNTKIEFNYKPRKNANQYLFVQWYNGYGESLLDYDQFSSMVRFGVCIKPTMRNFY